MNAWIAAGPALLAVGGIVGLLRECRQHGGRKRAEAAFRAAKIRALMYENQKRLDELDALRECAFCAARETPDERANCATAAGVPDPTTDRHRAFAD